MKDVSSNVKKLAFFNFFTEFKFYSPIVVIILAHYTGTYVSAMSIISMMSLSSVIMEFPTGVLGDIIGKKSIIIIGAICNVLGILLWALFPKYSFFLIGAFFLGLSTALFSGNNEALLFDSLRNINLQNEYHKYLGRTSFTLQIALAITSILSAIIANYSMRLILILSVFPPIIAFIIACTIIDPGYRSKIQNPFRHSYNAITYVIKNRKILFLSLAKGLNEGFSGSSYQIQVVFINGLWPLWGIGFIRALSNILGALSFYFSGEILQRISKRTVLIIANLYGRISAFLALFINCFISPFLLASSSAFFGVSSVANSSLMQSEFSDDERATMGSIVSLIGSIMLTIISIIVGYIADNISVRGSLLIIQLCMFIPAIIYWRILWKKEEMRDVQNR